MNAANTAKPILTVTGATKTYGGAHAIRDVDFDIRAGEVHALVGENGAGKSTLCKAIAGAIELSSGVIEIGSHQGSFASPSEALRAGIAMVYQESSLVPGMSVAQNIELGRERFFNRLRGLYISAQQTLQRLNFDIDPTLPAAMLGAAERQMVEIARAVGANARVIIFDEPTAALTPEEKQIFFDLVETLKAHSIAVIFISHALEEALEFTDRITVLRDGQRVLTEKTAVLDRETLVHHMVGRDQAVAPARPTAPAATASPKHKTLVVENVIDANLVQNMSFTVYAGQITGMAGLVGAGRTEIAKIIAGVARRNLFHGGMIYLDGRPVRYRTPRQAVHDGIVYVTEDRKINGFFETMSARDNIYLGRLATRFGHRFLISERESARIGNDWAKRIHIRGLDAATELRALSGGNQQKVVIAKSLVQKPRLVIFDEPTKGVDVGTIPEIHRLIRALADDGVAVLFISSYLPEIMAVSDRILVAQRGRIAEEFAPEEATEEKIMFAAVH